MKKLQVNLIVALSVIFIVLIVRCNKEAEIITFDIGGEWKGHLLLDGLGNEVTSDSTFVLNINQNNNLLTSTLDFRNELGTNGPIDFSGEIEVDSTLVMSGTQGGSQFKIYGSLKHDHSLEIAVKEGEEEIQFFHFYKEENLVTGSYSNEYKLELKLGEIGTGRSIILVHGMNDNAESWNKMLNYFDDNGIDSTNNVWVFEYKWWNHIHYNGFKMAGLVLSEQYNNKITQDPIIIAHSMGGLVSRAYIAEDSYGGQSNFYRLVTLSTPHLGSKLSEFVPFGDTHGVGDLKPGSDFLTQLNSDDDEEAVRWKYWLLNGRVGTYPSCYVFGHSTCYHWHHPLPTSIEKTGHGVLHKPNDGMVTNASARFHGDDHVHRVNTFEWINHSYLNKDNRVCSWVTNFIKNHP